MMVVAGSVSVVLGMGWRWRLGWAGRGPDLGEDVEQVDAG